MISVQILEGWADDESQPRIVVDGEIYDFGEIYEGDVLQHVFQFRNEGAGTLKILSIHASCGCTAVVLSEEYKELAEGQGGEIKVTFNSGSKLGRQNRLITLNTNDPQMPQKKLSVQGLVKERISVHPRHLVFGEVERGTTSKELTVRIQSVDGTPFVLEEVNARSQVVSLDWSQNEDGSYEIRVRLHVEKDVPPRPVHDGLRIKTTHPEMQWITLPMRWEVVSAIRVRPQSVTLFRRGDHESEVSFTVLRPEGVPFQIQEISNLPEYVSSTVMELPDSNAYRVTLRLGDDPPVGRHDRDILIKTNDPENTNLPVHLFLRVEREERSGEIPLQLKTLTGPSGKPIPLPRLEIPSSMHPPPPTEH